jgi:hypothetical protein
MSVQNVQDVPELFENNSPAATHGHRGLTPSQEGVVKRTLPFTFLLMTVRDLSNQYSDRSTRVRLLGLASRPAG